MQELKRSIMSSMGEIKYIYAEPESVEITE